MRNVALFGAAVIALLPAGAIAAVADSSANGFTVKIAVTIQAPPDDVYRTLVHNLGDWWSSAHTFSGNSHNLTLEEKPGGCFCEKLPNGGGVRHLEVVNVAPGRTLVLSGALGPLQSIASTGSLSFQISPASGGTRLEVSYAVVGYLAAGMNTWAGPVDGVLTEQVTRLKNYIEHGNPAPTAR
jgi:uncharacterized protein YndB with AHSA1/START domain